MDGTTSPPILTWRDSQGDRFGVPVLTDGSIRCFGGAVYVRKRDRFGADVLVSENLSRVFYLPKDLRSEKDPVYGYVYSVPASVGNLEKFLTLPLVDEDSRVRAMALLVRYTVILPQTCLSVILRKAQTRPEDGSLYRTPVVRHATVRPPTAPELAMSHFGVPLPSEEARTTWTSEPFKEALSFQRYSNYRLYSQQLIGAWAAVACEKLGIFYDMRVGKTYTAIVAAKHILLTERTAKRLCVVCPVCNLYDPWVRDLETYGFKVWVLDGTAEEDAQALAEEASSPALLKAVLINYERVRLRRSALLDAGWSGLEDTIVLADETSAVKNPGTNRTRALWELTSRARYVWMLNGTPCEQGPQDFYSQLRCLDPYGVRIGSSYANFCERYLTPAGPGKWMVHPDRRGEFDMLIASMSIRYLRGEADQFSGRDKTFRYVQMKATSLMATQARQVLKENWIDVVDRHGQTVESQDVNPMILVIYGFLREISCGYAKYKLFQGPGAPYIRVRHALDPKLLWVRCFLETAPAEPLVVYTNFNEQEQALKEMLDELGVPWSSTAPAMTTRRRSRLKETIPASTFNDVLLPLLQAGPDLTVADEEGNSILHGILLEGDEVMLPAPLRYHEAVLRRVKDAARNYGAFSPLYRSSFWREEQALRAALEDYEALEGGAPYSPEERAAQVARFNRGETHVFILKVSQGRGMSLARKEAVAAGIGTYPTIVYLSPPWSLGDWQQSQDRCVCVDAATQKNVNTPIYALVMPGMEGRVMDALRKKKQVQESLLKDAEREGYTSFLDALVEDMEESARTGAGDGVFDTEEMFARMRCGVPPAARLTEQSILRRMADRYGKARGWRSAPDVAAWTARYSVDAPPPSELDEQGQETNEDRLLWSAWYLLNLRAGGK